MFQRELWEFSHFHTEFAEFSDKIICNQEGYWNLQSLVFETRMLPQRGSLN